MSEVGAWRIEALAALPDKPPRVGGKKPPLAWMVSMVSVVDDRIVSNGLLKAWPADSGLVKVGGVVRARRLEYQPPDGGRPKISYMVVGQRAAKAMEAERLREQRLAALEARAEKLERFVGILLRERTEEAERRAGGDPDARRAHGGVAATEDYVRELANPDRKFQMVPLAAAGA